MDKLAWVDEKDRSGNWRKSRKTIGNITLTIHEHIYHPKGTLLGSCHGMYELTQQVLKSRDLESAKLEFVHALRTNLSAHIKSLQALELDLILADWYDHD